MRPTILLALLFLSACSPILREESVPIVVEEEAVTVEPLYAPDCTPGDDDGIGGTGCQVD
jgi:hypothetical protein